MFYESIVPETVTKSDLKRPEYLPADLWPKVRQIQSNLPSRYGGKVTMEEFLLFWRHVEGAGGAPMLDESVFEAITVGNAVAL